MASSQESDSEYLLNPEGTEMEVLASDYEQEEVPANRISDSNVAHPVQSEPTQDASPQAKPRLSTSATILQRSTSRTSGSNVAHSNQLESTRSSPPPANPPVKNSSWKYALGASIICLFLGFDMGVMPDAAVYVNKVERLDDEQVEVVEAILHILSLVGAAAGGRIADKIGRPRTIRWMGMFFSVGSLIVAVFPSNALLLLGRAFMQLGAGFGPMIATTYIAEMSPVFSRCCLASLPEIFINLGTLLGYCFNYATFKLHPNFGRLAMLSLGAIMLVLLAIGIPVLPESPRWLLMQGNVREAKLVLTKTSISQEEVDRRLIEIMGALRIPVEPYRDVVQVNKPSTGEGVWRELLLPATKPVFHVIACAVGLHVLQQLSGFDTIFLFSPTIIKKAGIDSYDEKLIFAIKFQTVKTVVLFLISTFLLDRVGRRPLLLISIAWMTVWLATLGTCLSRIDNGDLEPKWPVDMCVPSLYLYVAFYAFGMGPVVPIYSSEVFPLRLRAQGYAFAVAANQLTGAILAATFKQLYEMLTLSGAIFFFMGMAMLGFLAVYFVLPETKGQTLEETHRSFGTLLKWKRSAVTSEIGTHIQ